MKKNSLGLLALVALLTLSCSQTETPGGVKYTVLKKGDGQPSAKGQYLVMDLVLKNAKDSIWFDSQKNGYPAIVPAPDETATQDKGEFGVFKLLTKGDCVSFKVEAKNLFIKGGRGQLPKGVDSTNLFTFVVALKDLWSQEQLQKFQEDRARESQEKQLTIDSTLIADYLKENNLEALSTATGLRYIVLKKGKGDYAVTGKTTSVHYAGYLLDGTIFDTSLASVAKEKNFDNGNRNEPYPVVVNQTSLIQGWHEILQLMNKGMKVKVFIPSYLGYGPRGNGPVIPPNTVLMFDMEVVDIK